MRYEELYQTTFTKIHFLIVWPIQGKVKNQIVFILHFVITKVANLLNIMSTGKMTLELTLEQEETISVNNISLTSIQLQVYNSMVNKEKINRILKQT